MNIRVKPSALPNGGDRAVTGPDALDESLVRLIAGGDTRAMRTLFLRHQDRVYRFVVRILRDPGLAEDVISKVFFDVWRNAGRFEGRSAVSTWLLAIARNKALTALRPRQVELLDDQLADCIVDPADNPEVAIRQKDNTALIRRCIASLSPEHGQIIDLVYYQEKSIAEIGEILGIPLNTVKTRMFYARKRLGMVLEAVGIDR
jgi:RNA polymerase sigma-70 factor (ECF subfamily)